MEKNEIILIISIVFLLFVLIPTIINYKIFKKFNKKGYLAFIPIVSWWHLFAICDIPSWLSILPVANIIGLLFANFIIPLKLGKSTFYSFGYIFFPFIVGYIMLKEKKVITKYSGPDLLAEDPMLGEKIDLMAEDPNSFLEINSKPRKKIKDNSNVDIMNQLGEAINNNIIIPKKEPIKEEKEEKIYTAFDIPMPEPDNKDIKN